MSSWSAARQAWRDTREGSWRDATSHPARCKYRKRLSLGRAVIPIAFMKSTTRAQSTPGQFVSLKLSSEANFAAIPSSERKFPTNSAAGASHTSRCLTSPQWLRRRAKLSSVSRLPSSLSSTRSQVPHAPSDVTAFFHNGDTHASARRSLGLDTCVSRAAATLSSTSKEGFVSSASAWTSAFALSSALASALAFLALVRGGMVK